MEVRSVSQALSPLSALAVATVVRLPRVLKGTGHPWDRQLDESYPAGRSIRTSRCQRLLSNIRKWERFVIPVRAFLPPRYPETQRQHRRYTLCNLAVLVRRVYPEFIPGPRPRRRIMHPRDATCEAHEDRRHRRSSDAHPRSCRTLRPMAGLGDCQG